MMITRDQALQLDHGTVLHFGLDYCDTLRFNRWRVNGQVKTWKTRPNEFRVPIKFGMYRYDYLTHFNAHLFHLERECLMNA